MHLKDKIGGAIAGMVLGDAMGMPGELWPRAKLRQRLGMIDRFLDGPADNEVACDFRAGQYTDDSAQAFIMLEALCKYQTVPPVKVLAQDLLTWVRDVNGFERNLLGVSSKAALLAHNEGSDYLPYIKKAETNGAAMRIAPIGCVIPWNQQHLLSRTVAQISKVTHGTDVAVAGASMVAQAVASAIGGRNFDEIIEDTLRMHDIAIALGEATYSASCKARLVLALNLIRDCKDPDEAGLLLYENIGTGVLTSESVPTALAIAYYCQCPEKAALMCANLGGDTDTIGAMATAICGAYTGLSGIRCDWVHFMEKENQMDFHTYVEQILTLRGCFNLKS